MSKCLLYYKGMSFKILVSFIGLGHRYNYCILHYSKFQNNWLKSESFSKNVASNVASNCDSTPNCFP